MQVFLKLTRNTNPDCSPNPRELGACCINRCPLLDGRCTVSARLLLYTGVKRVQESRAEAQGEKRKKNQLRECWIQKIHLMIKQTRLFAYKMQRHINLLGANCLLYSSWYCSSWLLNDKGTFRKRRKHFVPRLCEGSAHPPTTAESRAHLSARYGTETQGALGDVGNALHYKNKNLMKYRHSSYAKRTYPCPMPCPTQTTLHSTKKLSPINHWGRSRPHPSDFRLCHLLHSLCCMDPP